MHHEETESDREKMKEIHFLSLYDLRRARFITVFLSTRTKDTSIVAYRKNVFFLSPFLSLSS